MLRYRFIICLLISFSLLSTSWARDNVQPTQQKQFSQTSLCFIENKGQITDQYNTPRNDIQFKLQAGNGLNIFIGNGTLYYQWAKPTQPILNCHSERSEESAKDTGNLADTINTSYEMYRMDVTLVNANPNPQIITEEKQDYYERYFNTIQVCNKQGLITNLEGLIAHSYKKITYKNIYPNIDWILYITSAGHSRLDPESPPSLKYDFVVHPGGNPKDIQLEYGGATSLKLKEDGSLNAVTPVGSITEQAPYSYEKENGKEVATKFVLQNRIVRFDADISLSSTLIIDPQLKWSTYYGGSVYEDAEAVVCDALGNPWISGSTASTNNIATTGAHQTIYGGNTSDAFLAKFNSVGALQFATYFGGTQSDYSHCIATDAASNIFIAGNTGSTSGIATIGAYQTSFPAAAAGFLAKFNSSGSLQWATYYGDTLGAGCYAVACDVNNNVYFGGQTASTSNIASLGAYQTISGGGQDAFLAKFTNSGARLWATYFGGTGTDICKGIVCEGATNVYFSGCTSSTSGIASAGAYQTTYGGNSFGGTGDVFLAKFTSTGGLQWATYYGGSSQEVANGITCDNAGYIYITGSTKSTNAIATSGAYQMTCSASTDAFLAKFAGTGSLQWATYFGSTDSSDVAYSISAQHNGYVYIAGFTFSSSNISTPNAYQTTIGGLTDAFLVKFDNTGKRITSTYFGGSAGERDFGLYVDATGIVYICGNTSSPSNIATTGAYQTIYGSGLTDAYLAKLLPDSFIVTRPFVDTALCEGDSLLLHYKIDYMFHTGNVFTAQLSGPTGSFASPVSIGTYTDTLAGTIHCFIPTSTASGSGYRIRVISSNPADTSYDDGVNIQIINFSTFSANSNSPLCVGDSLKFSVTNGIAGLNYNWSGPGSFNSVVQNPYKANVQLADSGIYTLIASLASCIDTETVQVIIKPVPNAVIAGSNSPVCAGDTLSLNCSTSTSGVTYNWIGPGYASSQQNPNILNVQTNYSGNYIITVSLNGCTAKDTTSVTVNPVVVPSVNISTSPSPVHPGLAATYTANPTNGGSTPSYQWKKNGVNITGATNPTYAYTPAVHDTICVVMHSNAPCAVPDTAKSCNIAPLEVNELIGQNGEWVIWPNPVTDQLIIESGLLTNQPINLLTYRLRILNLFGQLVAETTFENKTRINTKDFPAGTYILQITDGEGNRTVKKIVKQ